MNDPRVVELLEELVRWIKAANYDAMKNSIEETLNNEKKKKAFMLLDKKKSQEIIDLLQIGSATLSDMCQECARKGLAKKEGKSYKTLINLEEFGLAPKGFDPDSFTEEKEPEEPEFFKGKRNEQAEERTENN